jgi:hypothetical protein
MYDDLIAMPTFRPDGRLDTLHKGGKENAQWLMNAVQVTQAAKEKGQKKLSTSDLSAMGVTAAAPRPAPRAPVTAPRPDATVGNRVRAKRGSLLGSATS